MAVLSQPEDWGLGWLAVILGVISLYLYLTTKNPRRRRRQLPGGFLAPSKFRWCCHMLHLASRFDHLPHRIWPPTRQCDECGFKQHHFVEAFLPWLEGTCQFSGIWPSSTLGNEAVVRRHSAFAVLALFPGRHGRGCECTACCYPSCELYRCAHCKVVSESFEIRRAELDVLQHLAGVCDLYVLTQVCLKCPLQVSLTHECF